MTNSRKWPKLAGMILGVSFLIGSGATAQAITFGPNCGAGSCFGSIYTLTSTLFGSTATTQTYDLTLSVNTAGYSGSGTGLDAVAIKTVDPSNFLSVTSFALPGTFAAPVVTGLSANGCGGGSGGFVCTQSSNLGGVAVPNGTYTFGFRTTINTGTLLAENQWSIKGLYVKSDGTQAGLTSVSAAVPIPETMLLFGVGFVAFAAWQHRPRHASTHALS